MDEQETGHTTININCLDCAKYFEYTVGEQKFAESLLEAGKILVLVEPKRCRECRAKRKQMFEEIKDIKSKFK